MIPLSCGKIIVFASISFVYISVSAQAQSTATQQIHSVDFNSIIIAIVNGVFAIVIAVATVLIQRHVKDKQMADLLANAVQNSIGIVQQATTKSVKDANFLVVDTNSIEIKRGIDYVLSNAEEAVKHFKISPERIAEKIEAKIGLAAIATNLATTSSSPPYIAGPLAPVPSGREQITEKSEA